MLLTSFSNLSEPQVARLQNGAHNIFTDMLRDFCFLCHAVHVVPLGITCSVYLFPRSLSFLRAETMAVVLSTPATHTMPTKGHAE